MIDFPASPTSGQIFTNGGQQWMWDGAKWIPNGSIATVVQAMGDNRIINGDFRIDQRNNGASGTATGYTVDRWFYNAGRFNWGRNLNAISGPAGFPYYLGVQASSAYTPAAGDSQTLSQRIEADMISDFAWGTTSAQLVTLSFWVYSSLIGTFGGTIRNAGVTRCYPFSFSIPSANVWTKIAFVIPGDTAGTWVMSGNGLAFDISFDIGTGATYRAPTGAWISGNYTGVNGSVVICATNGATFYLTGVKLEVGSVATPFNHPPLAQALAACQRYYQTLQGGCTTYSAAAAFGAIIPLVVPMRAAPSTPTITGQTYTNASNMQASSPGVNYISTWASATVAGQASYAGTVSLSAEL